MWCWWVGTLGIRGRLGPPGLLSLGHRNQHHGLSQCCWDNTWNCRGKCFKITPCCYQVFAESVEVSGRSGVVMRWTDKISSKSAPADKASTSNTVLQELNPQILLKKKAAQDFQWVISLNACQDLFHFLLFFLLFLAQRVSSNPSPVCQTLRPPFHILSGSEGALGAKKKAAT